MHFTQFEKDIYSGAVIGALFSWSSRDFKFWLAVLLFAYLRSLK